MRAGKCTTTKITVAADLTLPAYSLSRRELFMSACLKRFDRCALTLGVLLAAVVFLTLGPSSGGAQEPSPGSAQTAPANSMCPVLTDEVADPDLYTAHNGKRVYFCCAMCKRKFERDPDAYVQNLPAGFFGESENGDSDSGVLRTQHGTVRDDHDQHDVDHNSRATERGESEAQEHDHTSHGENGAERSGGLQLVNWLGKFHLPSVHFPIALFLSAMLAELMLIVTGRSWFGDAARFCVLFGGVMAALTAALGWSFAGFRLHDPDWMLSAHRWIGTTAALWAILVMTLCSMANRDNDRGSHLTSWYRITLFVGAFAMATNGFLGGAMVYGLDHFAW
ncbi:MAG: YHS domain-containing protein [Planctomycetes bacterium]|nr:YHS domain-containing protein [Planctomycetota bacterium]NOG53141.1 YHS domain-containing protein [Planctomycetota bacterium]